MDIHWNEFSVFVWSVKNFFIWVWYLVPGLIRKEITEKLPEWTTVLLLTATLLTTRTQYKKRFRLFLEINRHDVSVRILNTGSRSIVINGLSATWFDGVAVNRDFGSVVLTPDTKDNEQGLYLPTRHVGHAYLSPEDLVDVWKVVVTDNLGGKRRLYPNGFIRGGFRRFCAVVEAVCKRAR